PFWTEASPPFELLRFSPVAGARSRFDEPVPLFVVLVRSVASRQKRTAIPEDGGPIALLGAAFVALRDHRDGEDLVESLGICHSIERLLVFAAESDSDEIQRCRDVAEHFAVRRDDRDAALAIGCRVNASRCVDGAAVAADHRELPLIGK